MLRRTLIIVLPAAAVLASCGAAEPEAPRAARPAPTATPTAGRLDPRTTAVALGARLRGTLRHVAVLQQPRGDAADLGQTLPTALVDGVSCRPQAGGLTCRARTVSPSGRRTTLRYHVTGAGRCFTALADPPLGARFDPTTNSASEDPRNVLASAAQACTGLPARPRATESSAGDSGAPGVAAADPRDPLVRRATPATLRRPIATYRRWVVRQLAGMGTDARALRAAATAGRLGSARRAWRRALERYERIGAAYGAFGALDQRIAGRPGGLPGGVHSARFTGLHRVELALYARHSTRDALPAARGLVRDVAHLRRRVASGRERIAPLDFVLRSHEVLEDTLQLQLSGVASPWASAALPAARGNLAGTNVIVEALAPGLRVRDPQRLAAARRALHRLATTLARVGTAHRWSTLAPARRAAVTAAVADAAEQLAYLPALADPRPPVARANPFGAGGLRRTPTTPGATG